MKKLMNKTIAAVLALSLVSAGIFDFRASQTFGSETFVSAAEYIDDEYSVELKSFDAAKKIPVIKAVREITGLGLGEAKAIVESAPKVIKEGVSRSDADSIIQKIKEAGGVAVKELTKQGSIQENQAETGAGDEIYTDPNKIININGSEYQSSIDSSEEVAYAVFITSAGNYSDSYFAQSSVLEVSSSIILDPSGTCGMVIRCEKGPESIVPTNRAALTETPQVQPLGCAYSDFSQSGKGMTVTPLKKIPGKGTLLKSVTEVADGYVNYVFGKKSDAENFSSYIAETWKMTAEIIPFSRLSYKGCTYNWVPSSDFKDEYEKMIKAVNSNTAVFGIPKTNVIEYSQMPSHNTNSIIEIPTEFTVSLEPFDQARKIPVIKAVREITGLGLGEAKSIVESAPVVLKENIGKTEKDEIVKKIEEAGGKTSVKETAWDTVTQTVNTFSGYSTALSNQTYESVTVTLDSFEAAKKVAVIKAVKGITGLGLGETKALVESAPTVIKENLSRADAEEIARKIEEAGGKVSLSGIPEETVSDSNTIVNSKYAHSYEVVYDWNKLVNQTRVVIDSYDPERKDDVIAAVGEITGLENYYTNNIVEYYQIVKSNTSPETAQAIVDKIKQAGGTASVIDADSSEQYEFEPVLQSQTTEFTVTLDSFDSTKKIPVIKAVRSLTGLGLGEAKALVESAPAIIKEHVDVAETDEIIRQIEEAGGKASKKSEASLNSDPVVNKYEDQASETAPFMNLFTPFNNAYGLRAFKA